MHKDRCKLGGIIKHTEGYGFKITFSSKREAIKYKEQIKYIIQIDGYNVTNGRGRFDGNK